MKLLHRVVTPWRMNCIQNHNVVIVWLDSSAILGPYFRRPWHGLHSVEGHSIDRLLDRMCTVVCQWWQVLHFAQSHSIDQSFVGQNVCSVILVTAPVLFATVDLIKLPYPCGSARNTVPVQNSHIQSCDPDFLYELSFFYREQLAISYAFFSIIGVFLLKIIQSKFETLTATEF